MLDPTNPVIVQGDKTVLLEATNAYYAEARDILARFVELEISPEYIHTYRITPLSLWEVHLLPAPVFRITAELQARRRLGLTATLVREDGLEGDAFSLIGPKKVDVPLKGLAQLLNSSPNAR